MTSPHTSPNEKNVQPVPPVEAQTEDSGVSSMSTTPVISAEAQKEKSPWRAFWDFFVLFSGISTKSNLSRTRKDPIQSRGLFLFRSRKR